MLPRRHIYPAILKNRGLSAIFTKEKKLHVTVNTTIIVIHQTYAMLHSSLQDQYGSDFVVALHGMTSFRIVGKNPLGLYGS